MSGGRYAFAPPNRNLAWAAESREVGKNSASPLGIESVEKIPRPSSAFSILDVVFRSLVFLPRESPIYEKINDLALDPSLKSERIAQIAKRLGQQPDYLNRRFKKVLGLTLRLPTSWCKPVGTIYPPRLEGRSVAEVGIHFGAIAFR